MTEQQREAFEQWFETCLDRDKELCLGDKELCRHAWQAALSHAERREFQTEQDLISFLDDLYETAGPDSSALTGQKWTPAQRAIEGIRRPHAEGEAKQSPAWERGIGMSDLTADQIKGVAAELARAAEAMTAGEDDCALTLRMMPAGTVRDDDGKDNDLPMLALLISEYPEEGVYPILLDGSEQTHPAPQVAVPEGWRLEPSKYGVIVTSPDGKMTEVQSPADPPIFHDDPVIYQFLKTMLAAAPTAPAGEPDDSDICEQVELPHVLAWADGIRGDMWTEYADRITDEEARVAQAVWAAHTGEQPVSDPDGLPEWPKAVGPADIERTQDTPADWDEGFRKTWVDLQVASENYRIMRRHAKELRDLLAVPAGAPTLVGIDWAAGFARRDELTEEYDRDQFALPKDGEHPDDAAVDRFAAAMLDALKTALRVICDPESPITDTLWASGHETLVDAIAYAAAMAEDCQHCRDNTHYRIEGDGIAVLRPKTLRGCPKFRNELDRAAMAEGDPNASD